MELEERIARITGGSSSSSASTADNHASRVAGLSSSSSASLPGGSECSSSASTPYKPGEKACDPQLRTEYADVTPYTRKEEFAYLQ